MSHHVIFLEGLPGSGKTVFTNRLKKDLSHRKIKAFKEGELNPIDLRYQSVMSKDKFNQYLNQFTDFSDEVKALSKNLENDVVTAFTKVNRPSYTDPFYQLFSKHELTETATYKTYKRTYLSLLEKFNSNNVTNDLYIFGGVLFQNHYDILKLKFGLNDYELRDFFTMFIKSISNLNPLIVYIKQDNVKTSIQSIANKRASSDPAFKNWFDMVEESLQDLPYSGDYGYLSEDGTYRFFEDEQQFETSILNELPVKTITLTLKGNNYERIYLELLEQLKNIT